MTDTTLITEGLSLMFVGMGFVMGFLLLLILAIKLMSYVVTHYFPESQPLPLSDAPSSNTVNNTDDFERLRPVIVAAIMHHRKHQGLQ